MFADDIFLIFHPFNKSLKYNVILKQAIVEKNCIKYLGVIIDSTLSWKDQLHNLSKKLSRTIGVLYNLRPFVNLQIMKNTYHALFYLHIVYGIHVWGNASDSHVKALQILQNRVVHLITYNDTFPLIPGPLPANPLFYKLELLKIKEIFIFMVCIFIYKCLNTLSSLFEGWFIYSHNIHTYKTRSKNLFVPLARTSNYGLKLMKVNGPKIWNTIPNDIRLALSLLSFKKLIKKYLIYNYNLI